jgi:rubrerythrin
MKTYICQICGDAYIGTEKPADCPFCGAPSHFIKEGKEANPIVSQKFEISEKSKENLRETYDLEIKASAIYTCMASKGKTYEIQKMFKRLAKIELEHAVIVTKLLNMPAPEIKTETCSEEDVENFQKTTELETHATDLYKKFTKEAVETNIRILFTALAQAEQGHLDLMKNYL